MELEDQGKASDGVLHVCGEVMAVALRTAGEDSDGGDKIGAVLFLLFHLHHKREHTGKTDE